MTVCDIQRNIFDIKLKSDCIYYFPIDRGSDRRPNLAKESELPQESYTSRKRVGRFREMTK